MKILGALLLTAVLAAADYTDIPSDPSFYEGLISNKTAIRSLFDCLTETSPCDEFGTHAKDHMVEALKDGCKECGSIQKHYTRLIEEIVKNEEYKEYFDKIKNKFDPDGAYIVNLEKSVAGY